MKKTEMELEEFKQLMKGCETETEIEKKLKSNSLDFEKIRTADGFIMYYTHGRNGIMVIECFEYYNDFDEEEIFSLDQIKMIDKNEIMFLEGLKEQTANILHILNTQRLRKLVNKGK